MCKKKNKKIKKKDVHQNMLHAFSPQTNTQQQLLTYWFKFMWHTRPWIDININPNHDDTSVTYITIS